MKKTIALCLLAFAILIGGISAEAKTTHKKSKAKTTQTSKSGSDSFSVKSFMKDIARGYQLKSLKQIKSLLTSNGFKFIGSEYTQFSDLDADAYIFKDSKGNEVVVVAVNDSNVGVTDDVNEITFRFINSTERDKFTKGKTEGCFGAHDQVIFEVEGNTVTLSDDCYYC